MLFTGLCTLLAILNRKKKIFKTKLDASTLTIRTKEQPLGRDFRDDSQNNVVKQAFQRNKHQQCIKMKKVGDWVLLLKLLTTYNPEIKKQTPLRLAINPNRK